MGIKRLKIFINLQKIILFFVLFENLINQNFSSFSSLFNVSLQSLIIFFRCHLTTVQLEKEPTKAGHIMKKSMSMVSKKPNVAYVQKKYNITLLQVVY